MRFCIVSTFYPPYNFGGDGIFAHRLANGLARRGHEVTVLHSPAAYRALAGGEPSQPFDDHDGVTVKSIETPLGKIGLLAVQQTGRPCLQGPALRRALGGNSFDVIHYNNVSLLGGPQVFKYGRGLKLCSLIEHWLVCPMHVLWKFDREVCTKPTCLRCTLHGRRPPQWWRYLGTMRRATRSIDAFIGPSLFTMNMHRERGLRGTMIQLPLFQPDGQDHQSNVPDDQGNRPYFLFVGRLEKIKGVQSIIPVFRGRPDVDLVIAGGGNYEPQLRQLADGSANIKFVGRAPHDRLQGLYAGAVATVVPSLCYETFGVVAAESFAASTPVIAFAQSSLEEIVSTHGGGLLYRSEAELKSAIDRLCTDDVLRSQLAQQAKLAFDREFAEEPFMRHYIAVVQALLERKKAGLSMASLSEEFGETFVGRPLLFANDQVGRISEVDRDLARVNIG